MAAAMTARHGIKVLWGDGGAWVYRCLCGTRLIRGSDDIWRHVRKAIDG